MTFQEFTTSPPDEGVYRFSWNDNPPEEPPIIKFKDTGILHPEGIALLTGPQGKGKSNIVHAIAAAALNPESECDTLGFSGVIKPAILIDTENPLSIFRENVRRGINRAGKVEYSLSDGVVYENIRGCDTFEKRQNYLFNLMEENRYRLYLIDGAGDFVLDVNDINTAIPFVSRCCAITLKYGCGILFTLHGNPGSQTEKPRGHLGSELLRKADCSLFLKVKGNNRSITTNFSQGKNRAGNDDLTQFFKWDNSRKMHISCDQLLDKKVKEQNKVLFRMGDRRWSHSDLQQEIISACGNSSSTANRWISELSENGAIIKNSDGSYQKPHSEKDEQVS